MPDDARTDRSLYNAVCSSCGREILSTDRLGWYRGDQLHSECAALRRIDELERAIARLWGEVDDRPIVTTDHHLRPDARSTREPR